MIHCRRSSCNPSVFSVLFFFPDSFFLILFLFSFFFILILFLFFCFFFPSCFILILFFSNSHFTNRSQGCAARERAPGRRAEFQGDAVHKVCYSILTRRGHYSTAIRHLPVIVAKLVSLCFNISRLCLISAASYGITETRRDCSLYSLCLT